MATYQKYGDYLRQYRNVIQPNIASFLSEFEVKYEKALKEKPEVKQTINVLLLQPNNIQALCQRGEIVQEYCYDYYNNLGGLKDPKKQKENTKIL